MGDWTIVWKSTGKQFSAYGTRLCIQKSVGGNFKRCSYARLVQPSQIWVALLQGASWNSQKASNENKLNISAQIFDILESFEKGISLFSNLGKVAASNFWLLNLSVEFT